MPKKTIRAFIASLPWQKFSTTQVPVFFPSGQLPMTTVKANIMVTHLLKTYPTHYARLKEFASYGSSALRNLQPQEVFKRTAKETQTKSMGSKCRVSTENAFHPLVQTSPKLSHSHDSGKQTKAQIWTYPQSTRAARGRHPSCASSTSRTVKY